MSRAPDSRHDGRGSLVNSGGGGCAQERLGVSGMRHEWESGCGQGSKRSWGTWGTT
jgi:hypothetical protein